MGGFLTLVLDERSTRDLRAIEYAVTRVDGRAVPRWLERASLNILQSGVPVGQPMLDLRIRGIYPDGTNTVAELRIDLNTGAVARSQPPTRVYRALLFGEQIRRFAYRSDPGVDAIAGALGAVTANRNEP